MSGIFATLQPTVLKVIAVVFAVVFVRPDTALEEAMQPSRVDCGVMTT